MGSGGNVKQPDNDVPEPAQHHAKLSQNRDQVQSPRRIIYAVKPPEPHVIVCAIDFGTTYTGYAFSFLHEYKKDKLQIHCQSWKSEAGMSTKTATVALFDPNMELKYFGYEAEEEFSHLKEQERKSWYLFRRFKMHLYRNKEKYLKDSTLKAFNRDDRKPAILIFTRVLQYLKKEILGFLNSRDDRTSFDESMIRWVLTVPAIWDDQAKIFMRTAAVKAGIKDNMLTLALEPEAASLYCRYLKPNLKTDDFGKSVLQPMGKETKYVVADLGGGTVDITVHKIYADGALQELHSATGGYFGGTIVDEAFRKLLKRIYGAPVILEAEEQDLLSMLELQYGFEIAKRNFDPNKNREVRVRVPAILRDTLQKEVDQNFDEYMKNCLSEEDGITFFADKMEIKSENFKELFVESIDAIVQHLDNLLRDSAIGDIDALILVGGYAEAEMVKIAMKENFSDVRKIIPNDTSLAVLKGAVLFGHEPLAIKSRLCKYTYGVGIIVPFKEGKHDPSKKRFIQKEVLCDDVFDIHIRKGDRVGTNIKQEEKLCRPSLDPTNNTMVALVDVYASTECEPKYVTDNDCTKLGSVCINLSPDISKNDPIYIQLVYAGTELIVVAREEKTGRVTSGRFDYIG